MSLNKLLQKINTSGFEIKINFPLVLFYLNYIIYGFYGANSGGKLSHQLILCFLIILIQAFLGYSSTLHYGFLKTQIFIKLKEIIIFISLFLLIGIISSEYLLNSLEGDEFSFLQSSVIHSIKISEVLSSKFSIFNKIQFKYLIHFSALLLLIFNFLFILFTSKLDFIKRTICVLIFLIFFRGVIIYIGGGNNSPHPPLTLLPSFIFSSFFGISSLFLKIGYQLTFGLFLFFVFKKIKTQLNNFCGLLIIFFIATIPVLNRLSTTLTPSLFTFIIFSYLLIYFSIERKKNYYFIFFLIAVGTMFRLPTLIIIIPAIILYLIDNYSTFKLNKSLIITISPLIITLPFLVRTFFEGTPATNFTSSSMGLTEKIIYAFETKIIYVSVLNSIDIWSLALFPFAFIFPNKKKYIFSNLIFLSACIVVYYSIKIELWGLAKYQVEFLIPFIIIGLINLCNKLNINNLRNLTYGLLGVLILLNINSLFKYPLNKKDWVEYFKVDKVKTEKIKKESAGVIRPIYNSIPAYNYAKKTANSRQILSLNNDYGIMPEIMSGFLSKDIANIRKNSLLYESLPIGITNNKQTVLLDFLNANNDIQILILGDWNNEQKGTFDLLLKNNWCSDKSFSNIEHSSITYVLTRCLLSKN